MSASDSRMPVIDAHVALASTSENSPPAFAAETLVDALRAARVDGVIAIAAQGDELASIFATAGGSFVRGIVCEVDDPASPLPGHAMLRGLAFTPAVAAAGPALLDAARERDLACELIVGEADLPSLGALIDRHPEIRFVLRHLGGPRLCERALEPWRASLRELARRPHLACKASGLLAGAQPGVWHEAPLWPYFDTAVELFRPRRLLFGSDWPAMREATTYRKWFETVDGWIEVLSPDERAWIMGGAAAKVFQLS